jgi:hypothetical protein
MEPRCRNCGRLSAASPVPTVAESDLSLSFPSLTADSSGRSCASRGRTWADRRVMTAPALATLALGFRCPAIPQRICRTAPVGGNRRSRCLTAAAGCVTSPRSCGWSTRPWSGGLPECRDHGFVCIDAGRRPTLLHYGSRSRTRTYDRAINSRLLYQLSYPGPAGGAPYSGRVTGVQRHHLVPSKSGKQASIPPVGRLLLRALPC